MQFTNKTDTEILICLSRLAIERNVNLTLAQKMFYLSLLHYTENVGKYDEVSKRYYVQIGVEEMIEIFQLSGNNFVETALKQLCKCGVIEREKNLNFKRYSNVTYRKNMPSRTFQNLEYLENNEEKQG